MNARRWGGVAAAAVLLTLIAPVMRAEAAGPLIQPGEYSISDGSECTLNFIFDGGGGTFVGTAAHCVPQGLGADVALSDGTVFGDVAAIGNADFTDTDWALIRVRSPYLSRVFAGVKGHPMYPRGVTTFGETATLSQVQQSGYALGLLSTVNVVREKRVSLLTYDDTEIFTVLGSAIFGDSGGPLVYKPTGKALGIVSRLCIGTCEMEGATVQGILAKAAGQGLHVALRTV